MLYVSLNSKPSLAIVLLLLWPRSPSLVQTLAIIRYAP